MNQEIDSQDLYRRLLKTARFTEEQQERMVQKFESAVFVQTLRTLLDLLPDEERKKLEGTMHFKPEFFLERSLAILQTFASTDQIVEVFQKSSEETFLEFFDNFMASCNAEQKRRIDTYLNHIK